MKKYDAQSHSFRGGSSGIRPDRDGIAEAFCARVNDESRSRCVNTHLLYTYREVQRHGFYHHDQSIQVSSLPDEAPGGRHV